jgi:hypothetical protein
MRAGCPNNRGYRRISINNRQYKEHRLAWLYIYDKWPRADIDHINGDPSDNRLCNLREATRSQNIAGMRAVSGRIRGVNWYRRDRKYRAKIRFNGKDIYLGSFDNPQEAAVAYDFAAYTLFEEFARLNVLGSECTSVSLPVCVVTKIVEAYLSGVKTIQSDEAT